VSVKPAVNDILVETRDLFSEFHTFEGVVKALNGVSVVVNEGETYGLVGESGCGKSVTVRSIMRIVQSPGKIKSGKILLFLNEENRAKGVDILTRSEAYMQSIRGNDISMIFQEASTSLNPVLSIGEQVGESFYFHRLDEMLRETLLSIGSEKSRIPGWTALRTALYRREIARIERYRARIDEIDTRLAKLEESSDTHKSGRSAAGERRTLLTEREGISRDDLLLRFAKSCPFLKRYYRPVWATIRRHVVKLLTQLGVPNPENIANRYPHELSGGMQQRIVIAIALACHPVLLIADEPTSNLDVTIQAQIVDLIKELKKTVISSVLFITHDLGLVAEICDRVTVMYAGDTCETAEVKELFREPLHPYTKGLLNSVPKMQQDQELANIPGTVPNLVHPPTGCRFHPRCPHAMKICSSQKPPAVEYAPGHTVSCHLYTGKE
jgi:peptide/nickel transport system ATP-binding protein